MEKEGRGRKLKLPSKRRPSLQRGERREKPQEEIISRLVKGRQSKSPEAISLPYQLM
jgi:hypothetical protein